MAAVSGSDETQVRKLLAAGADPNSIGSDGFPVLEKAITSGQAGVVQALVAKGADVNRPFNGSSPLFLSEISSNAQATEILKKAGAHYSDMDSAIAEIRRRGIANSNDAFIKAIESGDLDVLRLILRTHFDVDAPIGGKILPLHFAAAKGTPDVIRLLVDCGADVNRRTAAGAPVLYFAKDRPDNAAVLRELGALDEP